MDKVGARADLSQLRRLVRQLDPEMARALNRGIRRGVDQHIVPAVREAFPLGPTGRGRRSIRGQATSRGAAVSAGGSRAPHVPWIDFGGTIRQLGGRRLLQRPYVPGGRYIRPAALRQQEAAVRIVEDEIRDAVRRLN